MEQVEHFKNIVVKSSLYQNLNEFLLTRDFSNLKRAIAFVRLFKEKVDIYCLNCGKTTPFAQDVESRIFDFSMQGSDEVAVGINPNWKNINNYYFKIRMVCQRNEAHSFYAIFLVDNNEWLKIGQSPSSADIQLENIRVYKNEMDKNDFKEFSKAIGLHAHNIGIGAFVYLRRIFERLIESAHNDAKMDKNWDEEMYQKGKRMDERIASLRNHLPNALYENKEIYAILSKGIHELSEQECSKHFDVIRVALEMILEEKIEKKRKLEKAKEIKKSIQNIHADISKKK